MISAIGFVPQGKADPRPKRYELSTGEMNMLKAVETNESSNPDALPPSPFADTPASNALPTVDISSLPADLRMDEYDEEPVTVNVVGADSEVIGTSLGADGIPQEEIDEEEMDDDDDDSASNSSDSDMSDDDFEPLQHDDREYEPTDTAALTAMGLGHNATYPQEPHYFEDVDEEGEDEGDESDEEDTNLKPTDVLCLSATTDVADDFSTLEVYVYEPPTGNLYVHHDIALPAFPLCMAWGDVNPSGGAGNYVAIGTFKEGIEIWNLDVLDPLEPITTLGGEDMSSAEAAAADAMLKAYNEKKESSKKKKGKKAPPPPPPSTAPAPLHPGSHTDAVMALDWNKIHRQVLVSGSADSTVKLWDITKPNTPASTFTHHTGKVSSVSFHPTEGTIFASGGFDKFACVVDGRMANDASKVRRAKIGSDCEELAWDPFKPERLIAAGENGKIMAWDVRNMSKKLWEVDGGSYGVSSIAFNPKVPGMLATASIDKTVGVWDTHTASGTPHCVIKKDSTVGKLYTCNFYPSHDLLLGFGGTGGQLGLWEMASEDCVVKTFENRLGGDTLAKVAETAELDRKAEVDFEKIMAEENTAAKNARDAAKGGSKKKKSKNKGKKKVARKK
ncbi:hypothetical protein TrST_g9234 [Triparma strigata]|uniref:Uncharacterized protein n=1 Tax=Triparma strigata TaxID=1606541 RepID=A0A9W7ESC2_9STRA|nr:hypothetical protein TrST_g9234 [Triparma strigata]